MKSRMFERYQSIFSIPSKEKSAAKVKCGGWPDAQFQQCVALSQIACVNYQGCQDSQTHPTWTTWQIGPPAEWQQKQR